MARLMGADKRYFDKAMGSLAVLLALVPTVVLSVMWNSIPQLIPAHWSADSIDRWGQKWELLILPVICLAIGLLLSFFSVRRNAEDSNDKNGELDCDTVRYNIQQKIRLMLLAHEIELGDADA